MSINTTYNIGIDLGGTNIAAGIVSNDGKVILKHSVPTQRERAYTEIVADMVNLCEQLMSEIKTTNPEITIASVGMGIPGTINSKDGMIVFSSNLPFINTPITELMHKALNLPIYIENDANAAAIGESICGVTKGTNSSITITLGTGIGGGVIIDNRILTGSYFAGGEVGHHVLSIDGRPCPCGRKGCWESYASATALINFAKEIASNNKDSGILREVGGDIEKIEAKTVFDAADHGDKEAAELIDKYYAYVGEGLANMINIFQPEVIAMGGGVCARGASILAPIREYVKTRTYGYAVSPLPTTRIELAVLGNDAGIIGAASLGEFFSKS